MALRHFLNRLLSIPIYNISRKNTVDREESNKENGKFVLAFYMNCNTLGERDSLQKIICPIAEQLLHFAQKLDKFTKAGNQRGQQMEKNSEIHQQKPLKNEELAKEMRSGIFTFMRYFPIRGITEREVNGYTEVRYYRFLSGGKFEVITIRKMGRNSSTIRTLIDMNGITEVEYWQ